jgi:hypothetical protein
VGLLEAEGSFIPGAPSESHATVMQINMTDGDVIDAVASLLGSTLMKAHVPAHHKPMYVTRVGGGSAVSLMRLIHPLMGQRRHQQIANAIAGRRPKNSYPHHEYVLNEEEAVDPWCYWLAGYMEGQASFRLHHQSWGGYRYAYPLVQINSTDLDITQRVQGLWQKLYQADTNIGCYQPKHPGRKLQYHIAIKGSKARTIM